MSQRRERHFRNKWHSPEPRTLASSRGGVQGPASNPPVAKVEGASETHGAECHLPATLGAGRGHKQALGGREPKALCCADGESEIHQCGQGHDVGHAGTLDHKWA